MTIQDIYDLVATVNEKYNQILLNAKTIEELDEQLELVDTSFLHVSNNGVSEKLEIKKIIDAIVSGSLNELLFVGEITIDGNEVTVPSGVQWKIQNINYFTSTDFVQVVDFCSTGFIKKSIIVANTENELIFIDGVEYESVAIRPNIPLNTVLVTELNVTDSGFDYVISNEYVKKAEFAENNVTGSSAISLVLNSEQTAFRLTSNAITVVEGTAPTTQYISSFGYTGKIITIINATASNKTIKHSLDPWCFRFPDGNDFILGPNEVLTMRQTKTTTPYFDMICVGRVVASGGGGSQDIDETLENGSTALDKTIILDSTPDDSYDILQTFLAPGFIEIYSTENLNPIPNWIELKPTGIKFYDGSTTSSIKTTRDVDGNIVPGDVYIPPTTSLETLATREWVNTQDFEAKSNKATTMSGNTTSNIVYLTAKAIYDWAVGLFYSKTEVDNLLDAKEIKHNGIVSNGEKTLTNTTSAQAIYDTDLDAEANSAYEIFGSADFTGLAVVGSYLSFSLLGTATIDSFSVSVLAVKNTNNTQPNLTVVNSNGTQITSSAAISSARLIFFGTVRVSGAGTVKPSIAFSSATGSMKVSANAKFSFNKIGSNTVTNY